MQIAHQRNAVESQRLQKVLASAGFGSRRQCEQIILQGRVSVDGRCVNQLGTKVDPAAQQITVDCEPIQIEKPVYYLLNKPKGFLTTDKDPSGRPKAVELMSRIPQRLFSVGRLDKESEGLLLLTNDGALAQCIAHPRYGIPKTYDVQVAGSPSEQSLELMSKGVFLREGKVSVDSVKRIKHRGRSTLLRIVLKEGRNREIRRLLARLGHKVLNLRRIRIGPLSDRGLLPGRYRKLDPEEIEQLRDAIQKTKPNSTRRGRSRSRATK